VAKKSLSSSAVGPPATKLPVKHPGDGSGQLPVRRFSVHGCSFQHQFPMIASVILVPILLALYG
jgi:hypothetical protein